MNASKLTREKQVENEIEVYFMRCNPYLLSNIAYKWCNSYLVIAFNSIRPRNLQNDRKGKKKVIEEEDVVEVMKMKEENFVHDFESSMLLFHAISVIY